MRTGIVFAALVIGAGTAAAQTTVSAQRALESARAADARLMSADDVRKLAAEVKVQVERFRRLGEQLAREQTDGAIQSANAEVRRLLDQLATQQARLSLACAGLRPVAGQSDGFIGIEVSQIVMNVVRAGLDAPVERFARPPVISTVKVGSPAAQAGLRPGDEWLAIDRHEIVGSSIGDVNAIVKPGVRVEIRVRREGKDVVEVPVVVIKRPEFPSDVCEDDGTQFFQFTFPGQLGGQRAIHTPLPPDTIWRWQLPSIVFMPSRVKAVLYGATFRALTDDARKALQVQGDGVLVDDVGSGSQADAAGLHAFDVVVRANGETVRSPNDLIRISNGSDDGLVLTVVNRGETRTVKLVPR